MTRFSPRRAVLAISIGALLTAAGCRHAGTPGAAGQYDPDYPAWSTVLARRVSAAGVDYAALREDRLFLDRALAAMRNVRREQFDAWPAAERLAFLVNAHNAMAVDRIVHLYPVPSLEATQWLGSAREDRNLRLLGRRWSLRELADEALRPEYGDVRTLFLLNWAEAGCPALAPTAVTARNLGELLERQPRLFLADPAHCQYDQGNNVIYLSPLVGEHREAIERDYTTVWIFLERYLPATQAAAVRSQPPRIEWLSFDHSLNDARLYPLPRLLIDESVDTE